MKQWVRNTENNRVLSYRPQYANRIGVDMEFCDPPQIASKAPALSVVDSPAEEKENFERMRTVTLQRRMAAKGVEFVDRKQAIEYLKEHG
jgi:hypothetical protein